MRFVSLLAMLLSLAFPSLAQGEAAGVDDRPFALEPLPVNVEASRRLAGRVPLEAGWFTLPEVAALLEREVGVTVRFDWDGLAGVEVTPETRVEFAAGEAAGDRLLSMMLLEAAPDSGENYPTYLLMDGTVVVGTTQSLVRLAPQVFWPERVEQGRPVTAEDRVFMELGRTVTADFDQVDLVHTLDYIRDTTGVNIVVNWTVLDSVGIAQDTAVSCRMVRVSALELLEAVLEQAGASEFEDERPGYTLLDNVVYISTRDEIKDHTTVELYDIRDLLEASLGTQLVAVYQDDALAMELLTLRQKNLIGAFEDQHRMELIDELIELIRDAVGSADEWLDGDSSIRELNGNFIIKTTWHNHRAIVELLDRLRAGQNAEHLAFVRELECVRLLRRAEAHRAAGEYAEALALVEDALSVDPLHETARGLRLVLEETIGRRGE
ncbi:MAG: bacterial transcriptional activator domain-containing protein [Phycisphaerales bacterium JB063]